MLAVGIVNQKSYQGYINRQESDDDEHKED